MLDFIHISFIDILDILLVAFLIFEIFRFIKGTSAMGIFVGVLTLYLVWVVVRALGMSLLSAIMGQVLGVGVIAIIVIFQPEIRRFLFHFGTKYVSNNGKGGKLLSFFNRSRGQQISLEALEEITGACRRMSETKTGALIVFKHVSSLETFIETGDVINANVSRRLIENIFFKNSPLHDGAMVMTPDKIIAARCTLPITENPNIPARYGMRHRAALGITEATDAEVVVVSEETGEISYVANGQLRTMSSITELRLAIENSYRQ